MALTPYKSQQNCLNRSRSSSCSSPIRNRIVFQEIYSLGTNTLLRSYSCDQVFDKDGSGRTFQATQIHFSSFITPVKAALVESSKSPVSSPHRPAVNQARDRLEMAKKKPKASKQVADVKHFAIKSVVAFILFTATSACGLHFFLRYRKCSYTWDLETTANELEKNVFQQSQALWKINSVLKTCNSTSDVHVMLFTGGVGVGKTYSSSIISNNFPWSSNRLVIYSEHFATDISKFLFEPSPCGCTLIISDDLPAKATKEAIGFISLLSKERKNNENFLIILIFQPQAEKERDGIIKEFKRAYVNFIHVPFKPLGEEAVRRCFEVEIQRQGVEIPEVELKKLAKERMSPLNITRGPTGCKGVMEDVAIYSKRNPN